MKKPLMVFVTLAAQVADKKTCAHTHALLFLNYNHSNDTKNVIQFSNLA